MSEARRPLPLSGVDAACAPGALPRLPKLGLGMRDENDGARGGGGGISHALFAAAGGLGGGGGMLSAAEGGAAFLMASAAEVAEAGGGGGGGGGMPSSLSLRPLLASASAASLSLSGEKSWS